MDALERRFSPTMGFHVGLAVAGVAAGPPNPVCWTLRAGLHFAATPRLPGRVSPALGLSLLAVLESLERVDHVGGGAAVRAGLALVRPVHLFFPSAEFYALAGLTLGSFDSVIRPVPRLGLGVQLNFLTVFDTEESYGQFVLKLAVGVFEALLSDFRLWWLIPFYPGVLGLALAAATAGMLGNLEAVYTPVLGNDTGRVELRVGFGF